VVVDFPIGGVGGEDIGFTTAEKCWYFMLF